MTEVGGIAGDRLRSFVERIERLEEEKAATAADIREVYSEAKGTGFDVKILRQVVKLRKMDVSTRQEMGDILDIYTRALDMQSPMPLFEAPKPDLEVVDERYDEESGLTIVRFRQKPEHR